MAIVFLRRISAVGDLTLLRGSRSAPLASRIGKTYWRNSTPSFRSVELTMIQEPDLAVCTEGRDDLSYPRACWQ